ncbi:hypothetical protein HN385_05710 [archaeon]|jgi:hypothetical protein|nr:hypothetical protein [archaeon]MBT3451458.1 hypothetical protein [archaeon]MBT6868548.1 hypothetical protein [archaeon]MBT7193082.1 hypothetical protein [archaeon]MBT7381171.1 hypothetical protein [archaeon]
MNKYLEMAILGAALTAGTAQASAGDNYSDYLFTMTSVLEQTLDLKENYDNYVLVNNINPVKAKAMGFEVPTYKITCEDTNLDLSLLDSYSKSINFYNQLLVDNGVVDSKNELMKKIRTGFDNLRGDITPNINYFRSREGCTDVEPTGIFYQNPTTSFVPTQDQRLVEDYASQLQVVQSQIESLEQGERSLEEMGLIKDYSISDFLPEEGSMADDLR